MRQFAIITLLILQQIASSAEKNLDEHLQRAWQLYQNGEYADAIEAFEDLSERPGLTLQASLGLVHTYLQTGKYGKARDLCLTLRRQTPGEPDVLTLLGEVYRMTGKYDEARELFEQVVQQHPGHLQARLNLGVLQQEWGQAERARQTLEYFISYYQSHLNLQPEELTLIARACVYLNRVRDANALFQEATGMRPDYWQAYVPWGNLFLSKYNVPDAQRTFDDALKTNPNLAEAHLGLAKCYRDKNYEKAQAEVQRALAGNPNLVAAYDLQAELNLLTGEYAQALEKTSQALEINPNSLTTRTLRAVCFFNQKRMEEFRKEEQKILSVNPRYAGLYYQIAESLSRKYLFRESVEYYRKALALKADFPAARAGYGTSLSRLGEERLAKQELEKSFSRDPFNKYVGNLLTLFDEFPQYKTHKTGHLTIRIHEKDDPVLAGYAVELAERAFDSLLQRYDFDLSEPVVVEIFPEHDDFAVRCFGLPGAQAFLGICFGSVVAMDSPRARSKGDFVWGETLWHELVHVSHLRMTANRIPRWLAEGIAVYETSRANPFWHMNLDLPFIHAFQNNRILPLKDLDSGFNRPTSPGQVTLSYFQASKVVQYIEESFGHEKLLAMMPKFRQGMNSAQVIEAVFQKDIDDFDAGFRDFIVQEYRLRDRDMALRGLDHDSDEATETYLSEQVAEHGNNPFLHYQFGMYYKRHNDFAKAIPYLQKAKELYPLFVEAENPYSALADIYVQQGKPQEAIAELEALTAITGKHLPTLKWLATLALNEKKFDIAARALQKALYISPFESEVHVQLARAYLGLRRFPDAIRELQVNLLTQPRDLAGAQCELAAAYLQAGKKAEAKQAALKALEIAPDYERAQEILLSTLEP